MSGFGRVLSGDFEIVKGSFLGWDYIFPCVGCSFVQVPTQIQIQIQIQIPSWRVNDDANIALRGGCCSE